MWIAILVANQRFRACVSIYEEQQWSYFLQTITIQYSSILLNHWKTSTIWIWTNCKPFSIPPRENSSQIRISTWLRRWTSIPCSNRGKISMACLGVTLIYSRGSQTFAMCRFRVGLEGKRNKICRFSRWKSRKARWTICWSFSSWIVRS